jgi:hypothetical protein
VPTITVNPSPTPSASTGTEPTQAAKTTPRNSAWFLAFFV